MYYRTLYIIAFKITCDIEVHCTNEEVGQSKADTKAVQKKCSEFKKNVVEHTIFVAWLVGWPGP